MDPDRWERKVFVHQLNEAEIIVDTKDSNRLIPNTFPKGGGMRRLVTGEDLSLRAGFTKISKGETIDTYFWYEEIWIVLRGTGELTTFVRPSTEETTSELKPEAFVYYPKGCHAYAECTSNEPLIFLYCAVPASKKEGFWMKHMTPEDMKDIVIREEFREE